MAYTIPGFLKTLTEWLVSVSRWFDGRDITILVPALIILTVIAGVTGRAATGPRLWMQLVWGTVTVILGLIEVAIIWTMGPPCGLFQFLQKGFLDMNDDIG